MNKKEREEIYKAINGVSNKVNEVSQKQEEIQEPVITIHKAEGSINDFKF